MWILGICLPWRGRRLTTSTPSRDLEIVSGPLDALDHASPLSHFGHKLGVDATKKLPQEGHPREWPADIRMSEEIRSRVAERWREYGRLVMFSHSLFSLPFALLGVLYAAGGLRHPGRARGRTGTARRRGAASGGLRRAHARGGGLLPGRGCGRGALGVRACDGTAGKPPNRHACLLFGESGTLSYILRLCCCGPSGCVEPAAQGAGHGPVHLRAHRGLRIRLRLASGERACRFADPGGAPYRLTRRRLPARSPRWGWRSCRARPAPSAR
jgi:hypothetical protein